MIVSTEGYWTENHREIQHSCQLKFHSQEGRRARPRKYLKNLLKSMGDKDTTFSGRDNSHYNFDARCAQGEKNITMWSQGHWDKELSVGEANWPQVFFQSGICNFGPPDPEGFVWAKETIKALGGWQEKKSVGKKGDYMSNISRRSMNLYYFKTQISAGIELQTTKLMLTFGMDCSHIITLHSLWVENLVVIFSGGSPILITG